MSEVGHVEVASSSHSNRVQTTSSGPVFYRAGNVESRRLLSATPSDFEQYLLQLINRARANPAGEAASLGIDLNAGLPAGTISSAPLPPLAFNTDLIQSAQDYTTSLLGARILAGVNLGANGELGGSGTAADSYGAGQLLTLSVSGSVPTRLSARGSTPSTGSSATATTVPRAQESSAPSR
jgi:hypothetical protein